MLCKQVLAVSAQCLSTPLCQHSQRFSAQQNASAESKNKREKDERIGYISGGSVPDAVHRAHLEGSWAGTALRAIWGQGTWYCHGCWGLSRVSARAASREGQPVTLREGLLGYPSFSGGAKPGTCAILFGTWSTIFWSKYCRNIWCATKGRWMFACFGEISSSFSQIWIF